MANTWSTAYDPVTIAAEALLKLKNFLGMARRVYRELDRNVGQLGTTTQIRVPHTFSVQDAPGTAEAITTKALTITYNQWKTVKFELTDKELSLISPNALSDHISGSMYSIANYIDSVLAGLYWGFPWQVSASAPAVVSDILSVRAQCSTNLMPMPDRHFMVSPVTASELLALSAFTSYNTAGTTGAADLMTGNLGTRYGFKFFENQNTATHTAGALVPGTAAQANADYAADVTTIVIKDSGGSLTGTLAAGDILQIAGHTQQYAVTTAATAAANLITAVITPGLASAVTTGTGITAVQTSGVQSLAFHPWAIALAMAPLSTVGREVSGARVETVVDPDSKLALRFRMWYDENESVVRGAFDVLFGYAHIHNNLGVRFIE